MAVQAAFCDTDRRKIVQLAHLIGGLSVKSTNTDKFNMQLGYIIVSYSDRHRVTLTFESLSKESVEHGAAVFTECRRHVVVHFEPVWNVDVESLSQHLSHTHIRTLTSAVGPSTNHSLQLS